MTEDRTTPQKHLRPNEQEAKRFARLFPADQSSGMAERVYDKCTLDEDRLKFFTFLVVNQLRPIDVIPLNIYMSVERIDANHIELCKRAAATRRRRMQ